MTDDYGWYKRYPKKFIRGVVGLGPDLIGCYSVVLDLIYEDEDSCPNDPHWIGGILGCNGRKAAALITGLIAREKLYLKDGRLYNVKATSVLETRGKKPRRSADTTETPPRQSGDNRPAGNENSDLANTEEKRIEENRGDKKRKKKVSAPVSDAKASSGGGGEPPSQAIVVSEPTDLDLAVAAYNEAAEKCPGGLGAGWAPSNKPTANRAAAIRARLAEVGLAGWRAAMERAAASNFLSGRSKRQPGRERWGVDLGWIAKAENFAKLTEGKYDNDRGRPQPRGQDSARDGFMDFLRDGNEEDES